MNLFRAVQLQTVDYCNRKCTFCPNNPIIRSRNLMSVALYVKILHNLKKLNYTGRFSPYLMNEPLMDPRLPELIALARKFLPHSQIAINTNGDKIINSPNLIQTLKEAGLNALLINIYTPEIKIEEVYKYINSNKEITLLPENEKILDRYMNDGRLYIRIRELYRAPSYFWNRGGNVKNVKRSPKYRRPPPCDLIFKQIYILWDGKAVLCCSDWQSEVVVGKFPDKSLEEIWQSEVYRVYRNAHCSGEISKLKLCSKCDRISHTLSINEEGSFLCK